jgi:hypothetical protein
MDLDPVELGSEPALIGSRRSLVRAQMPNFEILNPGRWGEKIDSPKQTLVIQSSDGFFRVCRS